MPLAKPFSTTVILIAGLATRLITAGYDATRNQQTMPAWTGSRPPVAASVDIEAFAVNTAGSVDRDCRGFEVIAIKCQRIAIKAVEVVVE